MKTLTLDCNECSAEYTVAYEYDRGAYPTVEIIASGCTCPKPDDTDLSVIVGERLTDEWEAARERELYLRSGRY